MDWSSLLSVKIKTSPLLELQQAHGATHRDPSFALHYFLEPAFRVLLPHYEDQDTCTGGIAALRARRSLLIIGSAVIGLANGLAVPYLNTIASIKGGKNAATTVMPLISAALYLGQFISPLVVGPLSRLFDSVTAPYKVGIAIALVYLLQAFLTRKRQALPPAAGNKDNQ